MKRSNRNYIIILQTSIVTIKDSNNVLREVTVDANLSAIVDIDLNNYRERSYKYEENINGRGWA